MIGVKEESLTALELINEWKESRKFSYAIKEDRPRFDTMHFIPDKQWEKIERNISVLNGASREGIDILMTTVNLYHYSQRYLGNYNGRVKRPDKEIKPYLKKINDLIELIDGLPAFYEEKIALTSLDIKLHDNAFKKQLDALSKKALNKDTIESTINLIIEDHNLFVPSDKKTTLKNSF